jgi:hypothetical protein
MATWIQVPDPYGRGIWRLWATEDVKYHTAARSSHILADRDSLRSSCYSCHSTASEFRCQFWEVAGARGRTIRCRHHLKTPPLGHQGLPTRATRQSSSRWPALAVAAESSNVRTPSPAPASVLASVCRCPIPYKPAYPRFVLTYTTTPGDRRKPICARCAKVKGECIYPESRRKPAFKRRNVRELEERLGMILPLFVA